MGQKKAQLKRAIEIENLDGTKKELEIGKAVALKSAPDSAVSGKIYLEQMHDGKWRLCYSEDVIPDFTQVKSFNIIRGQ